MRKQDSIDLCRWDRKHVPVSEAQVLKTLKKPAVHEDFRFSLGKQIARSGDGLGRAKKLKFHEAP